MHHCTCITLLCFVILPKNVKTQNNLKQKEGNKKQQAGRERNGEVNGRYKI